MPHPYENIPSALKQRRNWVLWGIRDAPTKAPFNPDSLLSGKPSPAKAGIPETWSSYQSAVECVERGLAQGIGYEFDGQGDIYGVDLDHVISEDFVLPQAREIVSNLASYAEISPSGTGLHIFVTAPGADITRHRKKDGFVEIYSEARYFTVTGNIYGGVNTIEPRTAELQQIHDIYLLPGRESRHAMSEQVAGTREISAEADRFLRTGLARDKVLAELWEGARRIGNESADDQALMNKLAYWCNADPDAMIASFMTSPHYVQKDNAHKRKCERCDYLENTAQNALSSVYSTAAADHERWLLRRRWARSQSNKSGAINRPQRQIGGSCER